EKLNTEPLSVSLSPLGQPHNVGIGESFADETNDAFGYRPITAIFCEVAVDKQYFHVPSLARPTRPGYSRVLRCTSGKALRATTERRACWHPLCHQCTDASSRRSRSPRATSAFLYLLATLGWLR